MTIKFFPLILVILSICTFSNAQNDLAVDKISASLLENANSIIRNRELLVTIEDIDEVVISEDLTITFLNEKGYSGSYFVESYNDSQSIKQMEASLFNKNGELLRKFKKSDFKDYSAVSEVSIYEDDRLLALEFTPRDFPITIHYTSKVVQKSSSFIPSWTPIRTFYQSTENNSYKIINNADLKIKEKKSNFNGYQVNEVGPYCYSMQNIKAMPYESMSLDIDDLTPVVKVSLNTFEMEGIKGENENWSVFGKWVNDKLLFDTTTLPDRVKEEIRALTSLAKTNREKAEIVYAYMQDRSRYISVQIGIGGWKPINAESVHKTAYGDCKGLTNYTQALMKEVGVPAEYVVIYGGEEIKNIDKDFSSLQGNHAILHLPKLDGGDDVWLECTSKTNPFGYIAGFTDDRDALVITENGGVIKHTTSYPAEKNTQITTATMTLNENGDISGSFEMESKGHQYAFRESMTNKNDKDRVMAYKRRWNDINNLTISNVNFVNDKKNIVVKESLNIATQNYASKSGQLLVFKPVIFNRNDSSPDKIENRFSGFEIDRGYNDVDTYTIALPAGYTIDAKPENISINTDYGSYSLEINYKDSNSLLVKRSYLLKSGKFKNTDYENFRNFISQVARADKSKIVIAKI